MSELKSNLKNLKFSLEFPQIYLTNSFDAIINEIDLAAEKEILEINTRNHCPNKIALINSQRSQMVDKLKGHLTRLISEIQLSDSRKSLLENSLKLIESELENLYIQNKSDLTNLFYQVRFDLERIVFNNQTVLFLSNRILQGNEFGTLVFLQDEFIGSKGIQYLKKTLQASEETIIPNFSDELLNAFCLREIIQKPDNFIIEAFLDNSQRKKLVFFENVTQQTNETNWTLYKINNIQPDTFQQFNSLEVVDLSSQLLEKIDQGLFSGLVNLKRISLFANHLLNEIAQGSFNGLNKMESLNLGINHLQTLEEDLFQTMPNLSTICLSHNQLGNSENIFKNLHNLKAVMLSNNQFTEINSLLFNCLKSLKIIDFSNNNISFVSSEVFKDTPNIEILDLSFNQIDSINPTIISSIPNLKLFNLKRNRLKSIDEAIFSGSKRLEVIDLSENKVELIEPGLFNGLNKLKLLYLNSNVIKQVHSDLFIDAVSLERVDLSNNPIEEFDQSEFKGLSKEVEVLYV